jgi:hypothetical protein
MKSNKATHLQMSLGIVDRLDQHLLRVKGGSTILVIGLFAISVGSGTTILKISFAFFPASLFWLLDGYYLWRAIVYIDLYEKVREKKESEIGFSLQAIHRLLESLLGLLGGLFPEIVHN